MEQSQQQSNTREVATAYLQSPSTWNGVFTSETTLSNTKHPKMKMFRDEVGGLILNFEDRIAYIPSTNVKIMALK